MRTLLGWVVAVALFASPALADILPPGYKGIRHAARFENLSDFPAYVFYVTPSGERDKSWRARFQSVDAQNEARLNAGSPLYFSDGLVLVGVPKKLLTADHPADKPDPKWFVDLPDGVVRSERLPNAIRNLPIKDKRSEIVERFTITIADGKIALKRVEGKEPTEQADEPWEEPTGAPLPYVPVGLALAAIVAASGLIVARRWK